MKGYRIRSEARLDLIEIFNHLAEENLAAANQVSEELYVAIETLAEQPGTGHRRSDVKDSSLRFWQVYSWFIAYRYENNLMTVIRVVHGVRDFCKLFKKSRS